MSYIDDLVQELCPGGVEFVAVGRIAQVGTGSSDRKNATNDGIYPFYVRSKDVMRIDTYEFNEEAVLIPGEGGIGEIFHHVTGKYALHQRAYRIHFTDSRVDARFAYFYFTAKFRRFILQKAVSATVTSIRKPMITDFPFPLVPLPVQREIVRLLDQFTQLEAELEAKLEAELEARREQYAYYRDSLVGAVAGHTVSMGEIGTFIRGRRFTKNDVVDGGIPSIHYGEIYTDYGVSASRANRGVRLDMASQLRYAQPHDVIFAGVGETVEDVGKAVAWLGDGPVAVHDDTFSFTSELDPKYVAYAVQTKDFHTQKANYVARGKVKRLSSAGLAKITIPVPSVAEQQHIVSLLDEFDALVNDLRVALPAELAARRKQYEHYRDKLLTFEEASA